MKLADGLSVILSWKMQMIVCQDRLGASRTGLESHLCGNADAILHVEPDASKCKERAMLVVFNQNPSLTVNTTLRVPLYYSGLDTTTEVSAEGGASKTMTLARDWSVELPIAMEPNSFTWIVFE